MRSMSGEVIITETDDGASFHLSKGGLLIFTLPETPTTGYRWELVPAGSDCFAVMHDHFEPGSIRPGAAGTRRISLEAKRVCSTEIVLHLRRAWDPEKIVLRIVSVKVEVDS